MRSWGGGFMALAVSIAVIFATVSFLYLSGLGMLLDEVSWVIWTLWLGISSVASFVFIWPTWIWQRRQHRMQLNQVYAALYGLQRMVYRYTNAGYCSSLREALVVVLSVQDTGRCPCCGAELSPGEEDDPMRHGRIVFRGHEIPCPVPRAKMLIG
jgi:hypothetical protein